MHLFRTLPTHICFQVLVYRSVLLSPTPARINRDGEGENARKRTAKEAQKTPKLARRHRRRFLMQRCTGNSHFPRNITLQSGPDAHSSLPTRRAGAVSPISSYSSPIIKRVVGRRTLCTMYLWEKLNMAFFLCLGTFFFCQVRS